MLKDFESVKPDDKENLNEEISQYRSRLMAQQQLIRDGKIPVIVLVEGWSAAGKGSLIKELISEIDPRFYHVFSPQVIPEKEARYPFLYPFATAIPENGKIVFMDSGWMEAVVRAFHSREITPGEYRSRVRQVCEFERQLRDGGYMILKLFLHIEKDEQRCEELSELLPKAMIICGDATEKRLLTQESVEDMDAVCGLLHSDEANILLSLYLNKLNPDIKVITKVHRNSYEDIVNELPVGNKISTKGITAEAVGCLLHRRSCGLFV